MLLVSSIAKSAGMNLHFRRVLGNPNKPQPSELDDALRNLHRHMRDRVVA